MQILIIGSEGFIGSHCVSYFQELGHNIIGCDLINVKPSYTYHQISRLTRDYKEVFEARKYDVCINAAGNSSVPVSIEHPLQDFEANTYDTIRILEQIRNNQPSCKFIYISSAAVYGNPTILPVRESEKISPISPYGWHKYHGEQICKEYSCLYGIPIVILRPFSAYGPRLRKQIIWDLFHKFSSSDKVEVYGTGEESRDFIYITDLISAINTLVSKDSFEGDVYNIANGKEIFISEVVAELAENLGRSPESYFYNGKRKKGDPLNWVADISKLNAYGFKSNYSFKKGLAETVKWLKTQT